MRFHVVSLPHTHTTKEFSACAFTEKVRKFCNMMHRRKHTIFLYAGEKNEAECTEHISCVSEEERVAGLDGKFYVDFPFEKNALWSSFNRRAMGEIDRRYQKGDLVLLVGGTMQQEFQNAFPVVEFGIGYGGTFAKFRVFESYAWMHSIYSAYKNPTQVDGVWYDAVIPNYWDASEMVPNYSPDDRGYYLFVGRMVDRKGFRTAMDVCKKINARLLMAGPGDPPADLPEGNYMGVVDPEARNTLMRGAIATFVPTQYIEPFGGVAVESMACGTPVITTDWGAFPETVVQGKTGYRCRTFREFCEAAHAVKSPMFPIQCRNHFERNYSYDAVAPQYERYFARLDALYKSDAGWYEV